MMDWSWTSLAPAFPEIFIALMGMALLMVGAFRGNAATRGLCWAVAAVFAVAALCVLKVSGAGAVTVLNGQFVLDHYAAFMKILVLAGLIAVMLLSVRQLEQEGTGRFEYPLLVLFAGLGMMIMISANSLLSMYMGLELQSLSLYVLAAIRRDNLKSSEAGLKYFVLGALASGMMLYGISMVYGFMGSVSFDAIGQTLSAMDHPAIGLTVGLVFVLTGLAFKISAVPFHMWTPDVYEGAPTSVTTLFAMVPKVAAMALLMRVLFEPFAHVSAQWGQIIWFLSFASMVVGAYAGLVQTSIKRLMAYSSIGNMGYALVGVVSNSANGAGSVILYLTIYMAMTAGVFGIIMMMRRGGKAVENISDLSGLSQTSPAMAYAMAILMFSMSGIPPMAGFFGKLLVFQSAIESGLYVLAVLGVLTSVVAAYYYLRIIKVMFFDEPAGAFDRDPFFARRLVIGLSIAFIMFFILRPGLLIDVSRGAASALFAG